MKCNNCEKEINDNASYCPYCGKIPNEPKELLCPKCHTQLMQDMIFCPSCGSKLPDNQLSNENSNSIVKSCVTKAEPKYDVMIVSARNKAKLIRAVQREKQVDKKSAKDIVEHLPFAMWSNVTEKETKGLLPLLLQFGIEGKIVPCTTDGVSETPLQKHTATSWAQNTNSSVYDKEDEKRERKKKIRTIFNLISATLFLLASVFIVVLPLYTNSNGNTNLLMIMISMIKSIIANLTDIGTLSFLWIFVYATTFIVIIGSIYSNIKFLFGNIRKLIKHDRTSYNATKVQTSQISHLVLVIIVFGTENLLWETAILVGVLDILGIIACQIATRIKY